MFPPSGLPLPGEVLLITDELASPADFLLHRYLGGHLKYNRPFRCILLSVSEDWARWKTVAARSNVNITQCLSSQSLVHIDVASNMPLSFAIRTNANTSLRSVFDKFKAALDETSRQELQTLVILDDISTLEWIGVPSLELSRFARALCASCRNANAALIIRHHVLTPGEPDDLFRHLLQLCTYHIDVLPLSSGRSGSVSGQIALHAGPSAVDPPFRLIPRQTSIHYRLTDTGAVFFDRGTGEAVL